MKALVASFLFGAASLASFAISPSARADVPPPDTQSCSNKQTGDTCSTDNGASGKCADATCSRLDYSDGSPPTSVDYACKKCVAGGDPCSGSGASAYVSACSGKQPGDTCVVDGATGTCAALRCATDGGATIVSCNTGSQSFGDGSPNPVAPTTGGSSSGGGCAIGPGDVGSTLAVGVSLLALTPLARRRRRRPVKASRTPPAP